MSAYIRSEIFSFDELPENVQSELLTDNESSDMYGDRFVKCPIHKGEYLPLSMFMRLENSKLWNGAYGLSAYSAYLIKISRDGQSATVAYKHW